MDVPTPSFEGNTLLEPVTGFIKQAERVINITHKPGPFEYQQIAYVTGIGMTLIGVIGYLISMVASALAGRL